MSAPLPTIVRPLPSRWTTTILPRVTNAIRKPSGDQTTCETSGARAIRWTRRPFRWATRMSPIGPRALPKTSSRPSGDHDGEA